MKFENIYRNVNGQLSPILLALPTLVQSPPQTLLLYKPLCLSVWLEGSTRTLR